MKPSILVLTFTPIASEPRALKQIHRLKNEYAVTTAGFGVAPVEGVPHIELDPSPATTGMMKLRGVYSALLLLRQYRYLSKHLPRPADAYKRLKKNRWDIIIAHDVLTMPLANRLSPRLGVLADLHEYAPRQNEHSFQWRLAIAPYFRWIIRKHVSKAAAVTTVGQGIVKEYKKQFDIDSDLVVNATPYRDFKPTEVAKPIRMVHSGIPAPARKLEMMIEGVKLSSADVTLDLYLMPTDEPYMAQLKELASGDSRVRFLEPVPYEGLIDVLHTYDVGISLIAPTTFNLEWCLPNKFFDFIQARLGVIVGPSAEMVRYIDEYGFGAVTTEFSPESFATVLDALSPEKVAHWKNASHSVADELSGEKQVEIWANVIQRIEKRN